ncbi:hypothetical protein KIPB_011095 [Kipferlia bialata]|uniref:Uncharacterized protein n=1 Tax=Kipferlia bialata TaxID=797122 RepID=A0A391NQA3_9EUKA|nr:hypothetical protein KIPB_011095 [Kipferlia bialata]|eukprot:g11095.t1
MGIGGSRYPSSPSDTGGDTNTGTSSGVDRGSIDTSSSSSLSTLLSASPLDISAPLESAERLLDPLESGVLESDTRESEAAGERVTSGNEDDMPSSGAGVEEDPLFDASRYNT